MGSWTVLSYKRSLRSPKEWASLKFLPKTLSNEAKGVSWASKEKPVSKLELLGGASHVDRRRLTRRTQFTRFVFLSQNAVVT